MKFCMYYKLNLLLSDIELLFLLLGRLDVENFRESLDSDNSQCRHFFQAFQLAVVLFVNTLFDSFKCMCNFVQNYFNHYRIFFGV